MTECIFVGCDLHDRKLVLQVAVDRGEATKRTWDNTPGGREGMIGWLGELSRRHGGAAVWFVYEASSEGFGLYDELTEAGLRCEVLAPTRLAKSSKERKTKTDSNDAHRLLERVRGHVLGGNKLPTVWVPDGLTRDRRELVRSRLKVADKLGSVKTQIGSLLKRHRLGRPVGLGSGWTRLYVAWVKSLASGSSDGLGFGARAALSGLLRELALYESTRRELDQAVEALSRTPRYRVTTEALCEQRGVGVLTSMVYQTEMGPLGRFPNRKRSGSYLGLTPGSAESGEVSDRKGRITREGPSRVRKVLCQAVHVWLRGNPSEDAAYKRIVRRNPKHKKKAVVAAMRRMGIRLWRIGAEAQRRAGVFADPVS